MVQLRTWTRNSVDLWDVFRSRARHLQEAEVQRSHQWDNQEWSRERDVTQRQVLQVIVSAQGAARRDCRFQAETRRAWKDPNAMQGMQCMWSPVRKDKAMTEKMIARHSCGSCFVVVVVAFVVVALLAVRWRSCSRSSVLPPQPLVPPASPSSLPSHPQGLQSCSPATIWHPSDIPRSTEHVCLHNFLFYTHINMVFTSYLTYIVFNVP